MTLRGGFLMSKDHKKNRIEEPNKKKKKCLIKLCSTG